MALSWKYILKIAVGWPIFGAASYLFATNYIGGAATFFMLIALASWSVFPVLHFIVAAIIAYKQRHDPSLGNTVLIVTCVMVFLVIVLVSGVFNYV